MYYALEQGQKRPLTEAEITRLTRWRTSTFWVMLIGYIGYYFCRANLSAAFPLLEKEFGYTNIQLGLIAAYSEVAYAAGKFINGPIADRVSGRTIFLIGMLGAIIFNIIFGFSTTLTAFIIVWCLCRYMLSMGWGGLTKVVGSWYEPERNGTIMGFISINFQFGAVIATLFAGLLVGLGVTWDGLFFYPAAVLTLIMIWSYFASRNKPSDVIPGTNFGQSTSGKRQIVDFGTDGIVPTSVLLKKLFSQKLFLQLLVFSFVIHMVRTVFNIWIPKYLTDIGMGPTTAIMSSAVFPLMGCLGTIFIGWWSDNHAKNGDRARMMWMMLVLMSVTMVILSYLTTFPDKPYALILVLLGAAGFLLYGPYSMSAGALTLDLAGPQGAGTCSGMIDGIGYLGGAIASWGVGVISVYMGWSEVYMVMAVCGVLSALVAYYMSRMTQKARGTEVI